MADRQSLAEMLEQAEPERGGVVLVGPVKIRRPRPIHMANHRPRAGLEEFLRQSGDERPVGDLRSFALVRFACMLVAMSKGKACCRITENHKIASVVGAKPQISRLLDISWG